MAQDISKIQARVGRQDRPTERRSGVLPDRRNTNAPDRQFFADVRLGRRGDGGAEELRRVLGLANESLSDFSGYVDAKQQYQDTQDAAQGDLDAASGNVDMARMERSRAYAKSVELGRAKRDWLKGLEDLDDEVKKVIYSSEDADPAAREAKVQAVIDARFQQFAMGEDGKVKGFGSPEAQRWIASQMMETRASITSKANELIEQRMGEESITTAAEAFRAGLLSGKMTSFEEPFAMLLDTADPKVAKETFLTVAEDTAFQLATEAEELYATDPAAADAKAKQALDIVDRMLGSRRTGAVAQVPVPASTSAAPAEAPAAAPKALIEPFEGFLSAKPSDTIGSPRDGGKRTHNGEDYPMPVGSPIKAPMGGTVTYKWSKAGGHQAILKMDNGDTMGIAHLNGRPKEGRVEAGAEFASSGNSGKSSGPHAHITVTSGGKKVSPRTYFASATAATSTEAPTLAAADPSVLNPPSATSRLEALPTGEGTMAPTGAYSLTPTERYKLRAVRRQLAKAINSAEENARSERQTVNANGYLLGLSGVGPRPTVAQLREAAQKGEIAPTQLRQLTSIIEEDENELEREAAKAEAESNRAETKLNRSRQDEAEAIANGILAPVYTGKRTPREAADLVLQRAATISDPVVRAAVVNEVQQRTSEITTLRVKSPAHQRGGSSLERWAGEYKEALKKSSVPSSGRKKAEAIIDEWVEAYIVELGSGSVAPDAVEKFMELAEKDLDSRFERAFPPRPTTSK